MRRQGAEAATVAQEVFDLELLAWHDHDVVVEPRSIDDREARVVEGFDVDARDLGADLAQWSNSRLTHGSGIRRYTRRQIVSCCSHTGGPDDSVPRRARRASRCSVAAASAS